MIVSVSEREKEMRLSRESKHPPSCMGSAQGGSGGMDVGARPPPRHLVGLTRWIVSTQARVAPRQLLLLLWLW